MDRNKIQDLTDALEAAAMDWQVAPPHECVIGSPTGVKLAEARKALWDYAGGIGAKENPSLWIQSFLGRKYAPDIGYTYHKNEIANALAKLTRFGCQCQVPFTVAHHTVQGAFYLWETTRDLPNDMRKALLFQWIMHDAHEGMMGMDIPRPWKVKWPVLKEIEREFSDDLRRNYLLPLELDPILKMIDDRALVTEGLAHMRNFNPADFGLDGVEPIPGYDTTPWPWETVRDGWLELFEGSKPDGYNF